VTTTFKLLQAVTAARLRPAFQAYATFDLETTSGDIQTARIVEIGAVKVRAGKVVAEFGRLVNPEQPITQGAYNVHHIADADVRNQPTFVELLPELLAFIGDDVLVAHNGLSFDFPIVLRLYKEATGQILPNQRFDTLPLARRLFPGAKASVDALMQRFDIPASGERHRALDDARFLAQIFERLQAIERTLNRRAEHEELLELVAFGLYVDGRILSPEDAATFPLTSENSSSNPHQPDLSPSILEERLLFQLGARKLLSRFSELPEAFQPLFVQHKADIERLLTSLATEMSTDQTPLEQLFSGRPVALAHLKEVAEAFKTEPLADALAHFLDQATLYNSQDDLRQVNAVNLLTIHSAKGLEFPVVFVSGVEKGNLPSFYAVRENGELRQKKIDEQRRLLYVALTRAKQQLFITYVQKRGDYAKKRSQFLVELGIETAESEEM
jgi:DNA polymerase III epsilon subunit family exonuclease